MSLYINGIDQDTFTVDGISCDNVYVNGILVFSSGPAALEPPVYLLTEPMGGSSAQYWVENSSNAGDLYDGLLEHAKLSDLPEGDPWTPILPSIEAKYPQDGTIDLNDNSGNAVRQINTQWIAPQNSQWSISAIYNVDMGVSYDMYTIHYKGNGTCDVYLGSSTTEIELVHENINFTPPTTTWKITDAPPSIISGATEIQYNMDDFYIV